MRENSSKLRPQVLLPFVARLIVILSFAGCSKKSGQAVVLEKEHVAAREITPTPKAELTASSNASAPNEEEKPRELREDEIVGIVTL